MTATTSASRLTGTWTFVRFYLRRDRISVAVWLIAFYIFYVTQAASLDNQYASTAEFEAAAATLGGNPAFVATLGPPRALDTLGGLTAWPSSATGGTAAAPASMALVGRHARP